LNFSLLICVYIKENPDYLIRCLDSIAVQSVLPSEIVIVKDGPLTSALDFAIADFDFPQSISLKIVPLPENVTLGPARAAGLLAASNDWVAIMDTDDICRPDRFEKQVAMVKAAIADGEALGIIGGQISEFVEDIGDILDKRIVPTSNEEIRSFAKSRNPFNHMTVMLNRKRAIEVGNYRLFPLFEDYDLWTRMIKSGVKCANSPDVLVDVRAGSGMISRRRGKHYIKCEWCMQRQLLHIGFISFWRFCLNLALRVPVRLLPSGLLGGIYKKFARR